MYGKKVKIRAFFIILVFTSAILITFLVINSLKENVVFFKSPTDINNLNQIESKKIRVGGMVKKNSIEIENLTDTQMEKVNLQKEIKVY